MKRMNAFACRLPFAAAALLAGTASAFAEGSQGFGAVADTVRTGTLGPLGDLLGAGGLILGIGSLIMMGLTFYKMKQGGHHGDPSASPARAATFAVAGALLLALPATMGTGVATRFGDGASTASIDGSLRSVE